MKIVHDTKDDVHISINVFKLIFDYQNPKIRFMLHLLSSSQDKLKLPCSYDSKSKARGQLGKLCNRFLPWVTKTMWVPALWSLTTSWMTFCMAHSTHLLLDLDKWYLSGIVSASRARTCKDYTRLNWDLFQGLMVR